MSRVSTDQFTLSDRDLPALAEWQDAIERCNLLLPIKLLDIKAGLDVRSCVDVAGAPVNFVCERRTIESVVSARYPELKSKWSIAYAFRGLGDMLSSLVAGVAAISYARATGGVFYTPEAGPLDEVNLFRKRIDEVLAVCCHRIDLYRERYHADFENISDERFTVTSEIL